MRNFQLMSPLNNLVKYSVFFEKDPTFGNPAGVVETTIDDTAVLQEIAFKLGLPVLVFLYPKTNEDNGVQKIRFFYPKRETSLCIHGALAAAGHLLGSLQSIKVMNNENNVFSLSRDKDHYYIHLPPAKEITAKTFDKDAVCKMLNLARDKLDLNLPFEIASVGSPKLLIPVKNLSLLRNISPRFEDISSWSQENAVNGFYVYTSETLGTFDKNSSFAARNFNPLSGQNEDMATGVAAAALSWQLFKEERLEGVKTCIIEQGHFFGGHPCLIYVKMDAQNMSVGGKVCVIT